MATTSSTTSLTTSSSSSSESATPTAGHRVPFPTDAIRFFVVASAVICSFGLLTLGCCITYRIRRNRMRRLIVAAFEQNPAQRLNSTIQDVFDRERVRERIVQLRRGAPLHDFLKAPAQNDHCPRYFEALSVPVTKDLGYHDPNSSHSLLDKPGDQYLPLAAEISSKSPNSVDMHVYSRFSALSIDRQLALLYQVNGSRKKHKVRRRAEEFGETVPQSDCDIHPQHHERTLALTFLVSMPNPRRSAADLENRSLVLGTTVYPWKNNEMESSLPTEAAVAKES
ncbi:SubName: Full=Uncharacterized protein {ECO:0000313/EMBL:CCA68165.1} [Serendipita indica DSM 11827]|nr:SubName: Full=Uncharacterized protein {ECO:0000313/EMBL:CCA68165.1} [Serendipita indica DSM 11827]